MTRTRNTLDRAQVLDFVDSGTRSRRLLVAGDVMLDKYFYGEVTRISPEAPVPVTRVLRQKETMGGAANVVHNLARLGAQVWISGVIGDDYHGESLVKQLEEQGVHTGGLIRTAAPTTTKVRVIGGHQQMMRLDFEDARPLAGRDAARLLKETKARFNAGLDAVIISDYGKGVVTGEVCAAVIGEAARRDVPVIVDPKGRDWNRYAGADYITPNLKELNEVQPAPVPNEDEPVWKAARYAMKKFRIRGMLATRSECGMSLIRPRLAVHLPTKAQEVFDVSGAGDTVIAAFALALAGGLPPAAAAWLSNLAASIVVAKLGTYAVSREELLAALKTAW
ncbi:MAG: D-glycero-beta-D-manno-heptose-7-phosphate kinase [Schwartzia sp.]|nr:D-glycero-beta-D-manno-heptose-7-phosphate kinase [Schwartzia sp. (in: firmicutes)]